MLVVFLHIERKHCAFIERLLDNHGLSELLLMYAQNSVFQ